MIIRTADFIDELCEEFPDINRKSIEKICDKGMKGIHRVMRNGMELYIRDKDRTDIKFFIPFTPERQEKMDTRNYYRKLRYNEQKRDNK